MKKALLLLSFTLVISFGFAQKVLSTASSPGYANVLKMSASQFTRSTFQMGLEHYFSDTKSLFITAGVNFRDNDYEKNFGIVNELQYRIHVHSVIRPRESHRLYFAPYLQNQYFELEKGNYSSSNQWVKTSVDAIGAGMVFGWSYTFANRVNLDIYTGGGFRKVISGDDFNNYSDGIFDYGYSGILPRLGIDIGFWF
jgi:hypothetical protein